MAPEQRALWSHQQVMVNPVAFLVEVDGRPDRWRLFMITTANRVNLGSSMRSD
jgi:hypothetical protein